MRITGVQVIAGFGASDSYTVEFTEEQGAVISIVLPPQGYEVNRTNAVQKAKAMLQDIIRQDLLPNEMSDGKNQDGRASTMASSVNPTHDEKASSSPNLGDPSVSARDAVEGHDHQPHGTAPLSSSMGGNHFNNGSTPGNGVLPDPDKDDANMQPSS